MRALVVDHDGISGPAMLAERAVERGIDLETVVPHRGEAFPSARGFDFLIVMGAPWSLGDDEIAHWVGPELGLLREAVDADVPVLGVCFGAQALATVLGGEVAPVGQRHIGWEAVDTLDPVLVAPGPWLHWHGDGFTLPEGARLLARNHLGPQAFAHGRHLAVQFHLEATPALIAPWVELSRDEFERLGIDGETLLAETAQRSEAARPHTHRLFDAFLAGVGEPAR